MPTNLKLLAIVLTLLAAIFVLIHRSGNDWVGVASDVTQPRSLGHFGSRESCKREVEKVGGYCAENCVSPPPRYAGCSEIISVPKE